MGKNKTKKLAKRAAANATAAKSAAPASTPNPTAATDAEVSRVEETVISIPYSSEGPTLPVIGGRNRVQTDGDARAGGEDGGARKRKRMDDTGRMKDAANTEQENGDGKRRKVGQEQKSAASAAGRSDLQPLYEPWTLLPDTVRKSAEKRMATNAWEDNVTSVVYTRNQNIKSGINRLKALLPSTPEREEQGAASPGKKKDLIAISAQGEATIKLTGIIDMAKRFLKPTHNTRTPPHPYINVQTWYSYICLSNRIVTQPKTSKPNGEEAKNDDEDAFESVLDFEREEEEKKKAERNVPVLTVWLSKSRIEEFREAFGEDCFIVGEKNEDVG